MTQLARIGRRCLTAVVLTAATAAAAEAQIVDSFERLRLLVGPDDRITVTDRSGQEVTGSITDLSPSSLTLRVRDITHIFDAADVGAIHQRGPDSTSDGLRNGFWIGVGIGGLELAARSQYDRDGLDYLSSIFGLMGNGLAGAVVGSFVDSRIEGQRVIYRASGAARRLTVSPLLARGRRGVAVSLGF